ncbi:hypothetical protein BXY82_2791 [Gelidibacter sediminis]|uniref:Uncharacterized protein n=1 Tax=Gelidibacter sediminis TaxID=1608710 RepID=A0A4R7PJB6_9FLAO|nr:hypothetical protein [Gelidibacter sediminis]TDU34468.1 hypothetical protein BXY82_2791 [Gelidibacter sediminis]
MTYKTDKNEFNPEQDKEVKKGPLKPEHKNQYGKTSDSRKERNMSERVTGENNRKDTNR